MKPFARKAILLSLIKALRKRGSWSGETHIQKTAYFGQEALKVPLGFEFILYKHGPFSFDLSEELTAMQSEELIELIPKPYPYGPTLSPGPLAEMLLASFPKTLRRYEERLEIVARELSSFDVKDLERISTALYITRESGRRDPKARAKELSRLKTHIEHKEALEAVRRIDGLLDAAASLE